MAVMFFEGWWEPLHGAEKLFWGISIVSSVLMLILLIVSQIGLQFRKEEGTEVLSGDLTFRYKQGFRFISVKSIIAFFTFFGWTGVLVFKNGGNLVFVLGLAVLSGFLSMFLINYLIFQYKNYIKSDKFGRAKVLYKTGMVNTLIPANQNGQGIVHIEIRGMLREINAVTRGDAITSGSRIKVVQVIDDDLILVEPALPGLI